MNTVPCKNPKVCGVKNHIQGSTQHKMCNNVQSQKRNRGKGGSVFGPKPVVKMRSKVEATEEIRNFPIQTQFGEMEFNAHSGNGYSISAERDEPIHVNGVPIKVRAFFSRTEDGKVELSDIFAHRADKDYGFGEVSSAAMAKMRKEFTEDAEAIFDDPEYAPTFEAAGTMYSESKIHKAYRERQDLIDSLEAVQAQIDRLDPKGEYEPEEA